MAGALSQDALWDRAFEYLRAGDVLLADPGSGHFAVTGRPLPTDVQLVNQKTWLAIGWALPALVGAALAEPSRRHVCVIGDGAIALTVQELSTLIQEEVPALIIVLNNGGYLIEDLAIGRHMPCNDIWVWDYVALVSALDDGGHHRPLALRVSTEAELVDALDQASKAQDAGRLVLLDVRLDRFDEPAAMLAAEQGKWGTSAAARRLTIPARPADDD